jgi:putative hydrolase of the HAD superfamily
MRRAIFLDLDDTLIDTQPLYEQARAHFGAYVGSLGVDSDKAIAMQRQRSKELIPTLGYSKARFPQSFEDTLRSVRPHAAPEEISHARELAAAVFLRTAPVKPGGQEAIGILAKHFKVFLVTKGDPEVQQKRIEALPFKNAFADIFVVADKSAEVLKNLAVRAHVIPSEVIFIGDSLRSDIIPAVKAGMSAILVESNNWRIHEMEGHRVPEGVQQVTTLLEAGRLVIKEKLTEVLPLAWSAATSAEKASWSRKNPALGQCAVTSCVVYDSLGGDIVRVEYKTPDGEEGSHYFNVLPDGSRLDLTYSQFAEGTTFHPSLDASNEVLVEATKQYLREKIGVGSTWDYVLSVRPTQDRYKALQESLQALEGKAEC